MQANIYLQFSERLISKDNFKCFNRQGIPFLSAKFKAFEKQIGWLAKSQYKGEIITTPIEVCINAYYKNKRHCDCGNLPKSAMDSLQGIVFKNDNQIKKMTTVVIEDSEREWFEVYITVREI